MAVARTAQRSNEVERLQQIENWYRAELTAPVELPQWKWTPTYIGPTWQTEKINGKRYWVLPDLSLGWAGLAWCGRWLQVSRGVDWRFTLEQARFWLHWYAVTDAGRWIYRDGVFQRLKGHGKDPIGACLSMNELVGLCRVEEIIGDRVIGKDSPDAWVQTAAVSQEQTKNTMRLLPGMVTKEAQAHYKIQIAKETVYADSGMRFMQAVTSSPETLEGARSTFVLKNETHHWNSSNNGHDMQDVIERNATKSPGGLSRTLAITNAFEPGLDSVAERDRDSYENVQSGKNVSTGLLYDSVEAHPAAPLTAQDAPAVVETIRGDSVWLDTESIVKSILDSRNPPSRSRRFWYNQIEGAEDAWMNPLWWDSNKNYDELILPEEPIVMFFDGSKSDDATGLVGCRLSDGFVFFLGVWEPKRSEKESIVDRFAVNERVREVFEQYNVVAFFADPSDTRDDEGEKFWEPMVDGWHQKYATKLLHWAVKTGDRQHSIAWDMRNTERQGIFTEAAMRFVTEVRDGSFKHDAQPMLRKHVLNAKKRSNKYGISLGKQNRESPKKVDLAVCAVGARMLRRMVLNKDVNTKRRSGKAW